MRKLLVEVTNINRMRYFIQNVPCPLFPHSNLMKRPNCLNLKKVWFCFPLVHVVISSQHGRDVPHWGSHTLTFLCLAGVLLAKSSRAKTEITREMLEWRKKTGISEEVDWGWKKDRTVYLYISIYYLKKIAHFVLRSDVAVFNKFCHYFLVRSFLKLWCR